MALPLALTMGEPAGIGGEIALKAWLEIREDLPPFYLIDDPDRLALLARRLDWPVPIPCSCRSRCSWRFSLRASSISCVDMWDGICCSRISAESPWN